MKKYACTESDRKKIIKAKEILDDEFNRPYSLYRLAREVGMSPKKLAFLFKKTQLSFYFPSKMPNCFTKLFSADGLYVWQ